MFVVEYTNSIFDVARGFAIRTKSWNVFAPAVADSSTCADVPAVSVRAVPTPAFFDITPPAIALESVVPVARVIAFCVEPSLVRQNAVVKLLPSAVVMTP